MRHHAAGLVRLTKNPELAHALEHDHRSADVTARQRAILDYAVTLTVTPWATTSADVERMRDEGLEDRDILDVNQVVGYFAYVNRVADGLGVVTDEYAISEHRAIGRAMDT